MLEAEEPGAELVTAYVELAGRKGDDSAYAEAITLAEQALQLAAGLGLPEPPRALGVRGAARAFLGDSLPATSQPRDQIGALNSASRSLPQRASSSL